MQFFGVCMFAVGAGVRVLLCFYAERMLSAGVWGDNRTGGEGF